MGRWVMFKSPCYPFSQISASPPLWIASLAKRIRLWNSKPIRLHTNLLLPSASVRAFSTTPTKSDATADSKTSKYFSPEIEDAFFPTLTKSSRNASLLDTLNPSPPQVLIQFMPNNIFITVTKGSGHILFKLSSGMVGMKNTAKTQPKAALALLDELHRRLAAINISKVKINFRGINWSRPTIISQLRRTGLTITEICDTTGIPFNGCRPKKHRRT